MITTIWLQILSWKPNVELSKFDKKNMGTKFFLYQSLPPLRERERESPQRSILDACYIFCKDLQR